jgi:hypothetical protein
VGLGELKDLCNGLQGLFISHLLFADDNIFFARSDNRSVVTLKFVDTYCEASGQKINLQKSSLFFGKKCPDNVKLMVKTKMEVNNKILHDTYLGMPTEIARLAMASSKFQPERVWKCVTICACHPISKSWKGNV